MGFPPTCKSSVVTRTCMTLSRLRCCCFRSALRGIAGTLTRAAQGRPLCCSSWQSNLLSFYFSHICHKFTLPKFKSPGINVSRLDVHLSLAPRDEQCGVRGLACSVRTTGRCPTAVYSCEHPFWWYCQLILAVNRLFSHKILFPFSVTLIHFWKRRQSR